MAGGCGNGQVIFAHVIEKRLEWREYEATITGRKTIVLRWIIMLRGIRLTVMLCPYFFPFRMNPVCVNCP